MDRKKKKSTGIEIFFIVIKSFVSQYTCYQKRLSRAGLRFSCQRKIRLKKSVWHAAKLYTLIRWKTQSIPNKKWEHLLKGTYFRFLAAQLLQVVNPLVKPLDDYVGCNKEFFFQFQQDVVVTLADIVMVKVKPGSQCVIPAVKVYTPLSFFF